MSIYDYFHFSSIDEPRIHQTNNEIDSLTYPSFHNYSTHSPRSSSDLLDNYTYQRQISSSIIQQKFNQSISTRIQTGSNKIKFERFIFLIFQQRQYHHFVLHKYIQQIDFHFNIILEIHSQMFVNKHDLLHQCLQLHFNVHENVFKSIQLVVRFCVLITIIIYHKYILLKFDDKKYRYNSFI